MRNKQKKDKTHYTTNPPSPHLTLQDMSPSSTSEDEDVEKKQQKKQKHRKIRKKLSKLFRIRIEKEKDKDEDGGGGDAKRPTSPVKEPAEGVSSSKLLLYNTVSQG